MSQITLRVNASQASINRAIAQIKQQWDLTSKNAKVLYYEGDYPIKESVGTAYLQIGSQVRWGYNNGFDAWGFGKNDIDRSIAGQKEYRG